MASARLKMCVSRSLMPTMYDPDILLAYADQPQAHQGHSWQLAPQPRLSAWLDVPLPVGHSRSSGYQGRPFALCAVLIPGAADAPPFGPTAGCATTTPGSDRE